MNIQIDLNYTSIKKDYKTETLYKPLDPIY